ncbi:MAG: tetratricopeptide repeat protein [Chloroflexi bacterium]|nr:tetratricopeptide repeat protein [Chloroflexota bacterium]
MLTRSDVQSLTDVQWAAERGDHDEVLRLTDAMLAARPGEDAAHELRARALLALGRLDEAERHAADAVRLDPDEVRYRELLANVLSRRGAHRDAAAEFGRLARNDPRQPDWTVAEARERIGAAQASMGVEAARRAVRLDPSNGGAQLTLAQALARTGDARGALQAASRAVELLPGDPAAQEALADALWLADRDAAAFERFRAVAAEVSGADRDRVLGKARALYRQRAGLIGRGIAAIGPLFELAFRREWLRVAQ